MRVSSLSLQLYLFCCRRETSVGLPAAALERLSATLPRLHRVEGQGTRHIQNHRPASPCRPVGQTEESSEHELRQDVTRPALLLQSAHLAERARGETLL